MHQPNTPIYKPMVQAVMARSADPGRSSFSETYLRALRWMLLARVLDDKLAGLYRGGKIHGGVFLGRGQEALSVSTAILLRKGDVFAPLIRDGAGRLAFGETVLDAVRTCLGSPLGPMRARDGNVHRGHPTEGLLPMISHLGAMVSVVNGFLLAHRLRGIRGTVGAASLGDGATSTGAFHESLNQASVERLPLVLVVANNEYAYSTPTERQFACRDLVDRAVGYGITGHSVEGNDLAACLRCLETAVSSARAGQGPQLVVARLVRLCGHGEHDDFHYADPRLKTASHARDCLRLAQEHALEQDWLDRQEWEAWQLDATQQVETAVATAQREPGPDPYQEDWRALSTKHLVDGYYPA